MILKSRQDIALTYENLARAVFQCDRGGGPYGCAEASVYDNEFVPRPTLTGRSILKAMLEQLLSDGNYSVVDKDELLDNWTKLMNMNDQDEAIELIEKLVDFLNERGY